ncbi:MAG: hypothetical protein SangKO_075570 [Sandaracinaceae bacterium]
MFFAHSPVSSGADDLQLEPPYNPAGGAVLNDRQRRYAEARFRGQTQLEAARAAGYRGSENTLKAHGSRLAKHPAVRAEVARLKKAAAAAKESRPAVDDLAELVPNPKHQAFVRAMIQLGVATDAARAAGYSPRTAARLMKRADIAAALERSRESERSAAVADRVEVEEFWTAVMRGKDPRDTGEEKSPPTLDQSMRAAGELGRLLEPPEELQPTGPVTNNVQILVVDNGRGPATAG